MGNRLRFEKSPYLLQHAENPVDWYPWGEEAFETARRLDKPVFLSIGYSTCHWCHVMERESFETREAADALKDFVAVKVDREERPDLDAVYMEACQAMTGSGGWPLTILLTPDQKPFWAGTYLPLHSRWGNMGLIELLETVSQLWARERERLLKAGEDLAGLLAERSEAGPQKPDNALLGAAVWQLRQTFDRDNGGFGGAPKFPTPHNLLFLLRQEDGGSEAMAERTLVQMARGGLFDQIGGGFSRYSTDERWLIPHFEKMLYDNALLAYVYAEAYQKLGREFFRTVALRTLEYVLRELRLPEGGFCCGQDADSDGEEGKYYLFTPKEVEAVLGERAGREFCRRYGVKIGGNFEGKSVPNLLENPKYETAWKENESGLEKLRDYRFSREALHRDDKVLVSWNALAVCALAKAARTLGEERYLREAKQCLLFVEKNLVSRSGRLYRRWREGQPAFDGQLDDYAFLAWALLETYAADQDASHLEWALGLAEQILALFPDEEHGGFYLTPSDGERLIVRPKELYDGALPSGNSVAGLVLERLARLTGEPKWREAADRQLAWLSGNVRSYPSGHCFALLAMGEALSPSRELLRACAGDPSQEAISLADAFQISLLTKTKENGPHLAELAPFTKAYPLPERGEVYYLCQNGSCNAPVRSLQELKGLL